MKKFSLITFAAQVTVGGKAVMSVSCKTNQEHTIVLNEQETMFYITSKKLGTVHYVSIANVRQADLIMEDSLEASNKGASGVSSSRAVKAKEIKAAAI
jgi:hypothetical protein